MVRGGGAEEGIEVVRGWMRVTAKSDEIRCTRRRKDDGGHVGRH